MTEIIDAHHHCWQRSQPFDFGWLDGERMAPIRRDFLPADLRPHLAATGVPRTVLVQTQHDLDENRWALSLAERTDFIAGVVGWIDLAGRDRESQLEELLQRPKFVGVRHVTQDEPDDDFIVRDDVIAGLKALERRGVPFDLLFYVKHLRHAAALARALPDLPMVLDHLAKPKIREQSVHDWLPHFRAAAAHPNVFCKLSGLVTEADWRGWTPADLEPYVRSALDLFGPERCMFGSDWPVCELAASYETVFATLVGLLDQLSESEKAQVLGGTARRFYNLPPAEPAAGPPR